MRNESHHAPTQTDPQLRGRALYLLHHRRQIMGIRVAPDANAWAGRCTRGQVTLLMHAFRRPLYIDGIHVVQCATSSRSALCIVSDFTYADGATQARVDSV